MVVVMVAVMMRPAVINGFGGDGVEVSRER